LAAIASVPIKANRLPLILLASLYLLASAGCQRGPNIVKFDKVVYNIPALSTMTYEQAQQKFGAPTTVRTGSVARGPITMAAWDSADKTMGFRGDYDTPTGQPYRLVFYLLNGALSNEEELRKATNLQQNEPRLDVSISEAPRETRIRREGEMDIIFYDAVHADVIALQNTPAEQEFERKFVPRPP
jgi:hypothetical protein